MIIQDLRPVPPPEKTKEEILLFFKLYDPLKEELRYSLIAAFSVAGIPCEILKVFSMMAGLLGGSL